MSTLGVQRFSSCSRTSRRGDNRSDFRERRRKTAEGSQLIVNLRCWRTKGEWITRLPLDHAARVPCEENQTLTQAAAGAPPRETMTQSAQWQLAVSRSSPG